MPPQNDNRTVLRSPANSRKAYQAPKLCCYGDVGAITQAVATNTTVADSGMGQTNKTG